MSTDARWDEPADTGCLLPIHRNGIPWYKAPLPRRWHRCTPWTTGHLDGTPVSRCACGAILTPYGWTERNSRRRRR